MIANRSRGKRVRSRVLLLLTALLILAACGQVALPTPLVPTPTATTVVEAPATATSAPPAANTATSAPAATNTAIPVAATSTTVPAQPTNTVVAAVSPTSGAAAAGTFTNPIFSNDFADPFVMEVDGTFYAYATNAAGRNIQMATSTDMVNWTLKRDALPGLPKWASLTGGLVWAPEVIRIGDSYVLYYTARDKASNKQCVGVATATKPDGPFRDTNTAPFVCQPLIGGTIDASPFRDGDKLYLYYKNDGNCCSQTTFLYAREMTPDGLGFVGEETKLVSNDQFWEGRVNEAPTMWKHDGKYYLFYSGNDYAGPSYAVGYATCDSPMGPCQDAPENPILASHMTSQPLVVGPGHQTLVQLGDQTWIVYHVWEVAGGLRGSRRFMYLDKVDWVDGKPVVRGPTTNAEPVPDVSMGAQTSGDPDGGSSPAATPGDTSLTPTLAPTIAATAPVTASETMTTPVAAGMFKNPVIDRDFPDPDLLKVGDTYYAYATNAWDPAKEEIISGNIQAARSKDLINWEELPDPLPNLPSWADTGLTWAPDVSASPTGTGYVMYFVARNAAFEKQCIGVATSPTPEGPFTSPGIAPFLCDTAQGGSLDPTSYDENGQRYVLWKNDGNCCGLPTSIYLQKVSADGLTAERLGLPLITNDQFWEGSVVEAPTLVKHNDKYYLFYSANDYSGGMYSVGYAVADKIEGPYRKVETPLLVSDLSTSPPAIGPGGQDIVTLSDGQAWMFYHTWNPSVSYRNMNLDEMDWEGDTPVVRGPDKVEQAAPVP